jgi:hypothetical protein
LIARRPQCGDPIEASRAQCLLDARAGQHAAVAHHYHALQLEALLQLIDLCRQCHRIGGVAPGLRRGRLKHLDRDRAAVGGSHQADDNLRPVAAMIATAGGAQ